MQETQRLFVAVELPQNVQETLADFCNSFFKKKMFEGRCTRPENFHCTLKFLGDVVTDRIPEIDTALKTVAGSVCQAHVGALDVLPSREKIRILFAHLVCPELTLLAKQVEDVLADKFERENRIFKSHITVARIKKVEDKKQFLREVDKFIVPLMQWNIDSFVLKRSELTPEGSRYSVIKRYLF